MKRTALASVTILVLFASLPVLAAEAPYPEEANIRFPLRDDLYAAGPEILLEEAVKGDLAAAGGTVHITKSIGGDLSVAGGTIIIDAPVRDDVRAAGGDITLNGSIGGDVLVFGGHVVIGEKASITGDVVIAAGSVTIDGKIHGNLKVTGTEVSLLGVIDGAADVRSERLTLSTLIRKGGVLAARQWYVGDDARIIGNLRYWQPQGERDFTNVITGKATLDPALAVEETTSVTAGGAMMVLTAITAFSLFSGVLIIVLLLLLTKTFFRDTAKRLRASPGRSLLVGVLYFLLTPIAVLVCFGTVIGIPIGLLLLAGYAFSIIFAKPLTAIVLARWIELTYKKPLHGAVFCLLSIVLFLILKLLFIVPFLGWLLLVLAVCMSFGALSMTKWERFLKIR